MGEFHERSNAKSIICDTTSTFSERKVSPSMIPALEWLPRYLHRDMRSQRNPATQKSPYQVKISIKILCDESMMLSVGKYRSISVGRTQENICTIPYGPCPNNTLATESRLPIIVYFMSTNLDMSESHFVLSCVSP